MDQWTIMSMCHKLKLMVTPILFFAPEAQGGKEEKKNIA